MVCRRPHTNRRVNTNSQTRHVNDEKKPSLVADVTHQRRKLTNMHMPHAMYVHAMHVHVASCPCHAAVELRKQAPELQRGRSFDRTAFAFLRLNQDLPEHTGSTGKSCQKRRCAKLQSNFPCGETAPRGQHTKRMAVFVTSSLMAFTTVS